MESQCVRLPLNRITKEQWMASRRSEWQRTHGRRQTIEQVWTSRPTLNGVSEADSPHDLHRETIDQGGQADTATDTASEPDVEIMSKAPASLHRRKDDWNDAEDASTRRLWMRRRRVEPCELMLLRHAQARERALSISALQRPVMSMLLDVNDDALNARHAEAGRTTTHRTSDAGGGDDASGANTREPALVLLHPEKTSWGRTVPTAHVRGADGAQSRGIGGKPGCTPVAASGESKAAAIELILLNELEELEGEQIRISAQRVGRPESAPMRVVQRHATRKSRSWAAPSTLAQISSHACCEQSGDFAPSRMGLVHTHDLGGSGVPVCSPVYSSRALVFHHRRGHASAVLVDHPCQKLLQVQTL